MCRREDNVDFLNKVVIILFIICSAIILGVIAFLGFMAFCAYSLYTL